MLKVFSYGKTVAPSIGRDPEAIKLVAKLQDYVVCQNDSSRYCGVSINFLKENQESLTHKLDIVLHITVIHWR